MELGLLPRGQESCIVVEYVIFYHSSTPARVRIYDYGRPLLRLSRVEVRLKRKLVAPRTCDRVRVRPRPGLFKISNLHVFNNFGGYWKSIGVRRPRYFDRDASFLEHAFGLELKVCPRFVVTRIYARVGAVDERERLPDCRAAIREKPASHIRERRYLVVGVRDLSRFNSSIAFKCDPRKLIRPLRHQIIGIVKG